MRQFPLDVGGQLLNFDTDGRVLDAAAKAVGQWATTADNKIQLRPNGGGAPIDVAVSWVFNASNQLTLMHGERAVFTIVESSDGLPRYRLNKNQLVVDPDGDSDFEFTLSCLWGLNADGNLVVSISGKESTLDGFIEDSKSRFRFNFKDKSGDHLPNSLVFGGQWERRADVTDAIHLHFVLDDKALEIAAQPLNLPQALRVDKQRNHLVMVYQSKSHNEKRLQFMGSLEIRPNLTLVFRIDEVKEAGLRKSAITVESSFEFDRFSGALQLYVGKTRTPTSQKVEISGALKVKLKNNAALDWTFAYAKSTSAGVTTISIATALNFEFKDNKFFISYQQEGKTRRLEVTAKIRDEDFSVDFGATITNDPQGRSLKGFIGLSW